MYPMIETIFSTGREIVERLYNTQKDNLHEASMLIAEAHKNGHKFLSAEADILIRLQKNCMDAQEHWHLLYQS